MTTTSPAPEPTASGTAVRRKEDARLLTGRGRYVSDLALPRMRHVAFVRSPLAHARITSVDVGEALETGGVSAVFTGDHPALASVALRAQSGLPGYVETDQPPLARGKVRFAGEAVAAIVADDRYHAEDGAEGVDVEYEPLTPRSVRGPTRSTPCTTRRRTTSCSPAPSVPATSRPRSPRPRSSWTAR